MSQLIRDAKRKEREDKQAGTGRYVFRNVSHADIVLPKPSYDVPHRKHIPPGGTFLGDSYHQNAFLHDGSIRLVQVHEDSDDVKAQAARNIELVNVYDPATGKTTRMTPAELKVSKEKKGKKGTPVDAVD